jgi:hypothetical protein
MRIPVAAGALTAFLIVMAGGLSPAAADGALAIGMPPSVVDDGFAFGWSTNYRNSEDAQRDALDNCSKYQNAPAAAAVCKVVSTFKNECVAVSMDPDEGTPGVGWGVMPDKASAERRALEECRKTSGQGREKFCEISMSQCDGSAR